MARRRFILQSSHLVMWSSPLLLLVLVFTLNSRPLRHASAASPTTTTTATTMPTTTTGPPATPAAQHSTDSTTTTTSEPSTPATSTTTSTTARTATVTSDPVRTTAPTSSTTTPVPTTSVAPRPSSSSTTTSVATSKPNAVTRIDGRLTLASPAALIPVRGPGQWTLRATHAVDVILQCGSHSAVVTGIVTIPRDQKCDVDITIATGAPTAWTLSAVR